jgi:FMN phosphatase YigB (HAD superfamily)
MTSTAILFDLDGTLLPLEFNEFMPRYFGGLHDAFHALFPDGSVPRAVLASTDAMVNNDGSQSNAAAFWADFTARVGLGRDQLEPVFASFYRDGFPALGAGVDQWQDAAAVVGAARATGAKIVLATNPVFPREAIEHRLRWAGVDAEMFDFITDYENMKFTKPNPGYYRQIAHEVGVDAATCLMIGNDVGLDLAPARAVGMRTFMVRSAYSDYGPDGFAADYEGTLSDLVTFLTHHARD